MFEDVTSKLGASEDRIDDVWCSITIAGSPGEERLAWTVRKFRMTEAISEPYKLSVEASASLPEDRDSEDFEIDDLLGGDATLEIIRGGIVRAISGVIQRASLAALERGSVVVSLQVVPTWSYLAQHIDTRIFQDLTVPEILQTVLSEALAPYQRTIDISLLHEEYVVRDYCVQHAESVLDFASRLMEEEGISYVFRSEARESNGPGVEVMVLLDQEDAVNADFEEIEGAFDGEVRIIPDHPELADVESIQAIQWILPERPNKVVIRGYNWKEPSPKGRSPQVERSSAPRRNRLREIYIPDDRRRVVDKKNDDDYVGTTVEEDEQPLARRRYELTVGDVARGLASSNLICMCAGGIFPLGNHPNPAICNVRLLTTQVTHVGDVVGQTVRYHNSFSCILADTPFRPPLKTPRPRIFGPQTAIVTGPAGEEIHTDKHGRIKVRFHWDRLSPHDDTSSCWVRVAQMWAGPGWGTWFVPRVGMEVVVEFLDGNPDRPLVTGCVYNGANGTPYPLPDEKTKSTIKTNSSLGGGGSNELRFEDAKGSEEIYTHAQKDYNEVVENDHGTTVNANQTNTVKGNQTQSVGGNQSESISGEQTMSVTKNRTVTIDGSQAVTITGGQANVGVSGSKLSITGDYKVDVSNVIEVQAPTHIKLTVGGSSILIEPNKITIEAGGLSKVVFDANAEMTSSAGSKVKLDGDALTVASQGAQVKLTADAQVLAAGGGELKLTGDADLYGAKAVVSGTVAKLELTGDASLEGTNVSLSGEAKVGIAGGAVNSAASGSNEITGAVVKIN